MLILASLRYFIRSAGWRRAPAGALIAQQADPQKPARRSRHGIIIGIQPSSNAVRRLIPQADMDCEARPGCQIACELGQAVDHCSTVALPIASGS